MLCNAIVVQTKYLLNKKGAIVTFCILLSMVLINYVNNVIYFQGKDSVEMYHFLKITLLSYNRVYFNGTNTLFLIQLYPILVVCPAGLSLYYEQQSGMSLYLTSRLGKREYLISRYLAAFATTFIVFVLPFFLEMIMNCVSFPISAAGDLSNLSVYDVEYIASIDNYLLKNLYENSIFLYYIIEIALWGMFSGLLCAVSISFAALFKVRYGVLAFFPVFLLLNASLILSNSKLTGDISWKWYDYLLMFNDEKKSFLVAVAGLLLLCLYNVISIYILSRKDCLE